MRSLAKLLSVLLLRSSCTPPQKATGPTWSEGAIAFDGAAANDTQRSTTGYNKMRSLPVLCDITILLEIPVTESISKEGHASSMPLQDHTEPYVRMAEQVLNPCGMDNVLVLSDLPSSVDNGTFLLSLTSCKILLHDTGGGVQNTSHSSDSTHLSELLPVHAVPSTFSFKFEDNSSELSRLQIDAIEDETPNKIIFGSQGILATLDVAFDYDPALNRFNEVQEPTSEPEPQREVSTAALRDEEAPLRSEVVPPLLEERQERFRQFMCMAHEPPPTYSDLHSDRLLHFLQEVVEKEAKELDWMLRCLFFVGVLLSSVYLFTAWRLLQHRKTPRKRNPDKKISQPFLWSFLMAAKSLGSYVVAVGTRCTQKVRFTRTRGNKDNSVDGMRNPPVSSVTWKRWSPIRTPSIRKSSQRTPPSREFTSSSSHFSEPSSLSEDSLQVTDNKTEQACRQPVSSTPSPSQKDPVVVQENNGDARSMPLLEDEPLSPCSELNRAWVLNKDIRRSNRNLSTKMGIVPTPPEESQQPALLEEAASESEHGLETSQLGSVALPEDRHGVESGSPRNVAVAEHSHDGPLAMTEKEETRSSKSWIQDYWSK